MYLARFGLDPGQRRPGDRDWTGAEIRACCRLAALLDVPLVEAARNIVPVAVTAGESVERLRSWAAGRCLSADRPGLYTRAADAADQARPQRPARPVVQLSRAGIRIGPDPHPSSRSRSANPLRGRRAGWPVAPHHSEEAPMTTLLDHLDSRPTAAATGTTTTPAQRLRATMAAARVSFTWLGTQKTLNPDQKARAAEAFGAEGQYLSAGKKLLDTGHPAFRAVTAIRGKVDAYWKGLSLPFPEPGVRLIRHDAVEAFAAQMADFRAELDDAVANLDRHYGELKQAARDRLGSLFNAVRLPRDPGRPLRRGRGLPHGRAARLPGPALARAVRGRAGAGGGPVRGGRPAGRAGLPRRVRPAGRPPDRADLRRRARTASPWSSATRPSSNLAEFFERFRTLNVRSQRPARRPGGRGPAGGPGRRGPGPPRRRRAPPRGGRPALAGPGLARRDAGRAAPAADPPAGRRAGGVA